MIVQTDADGTIYKGNLLISLGWIYLRFLFRKKKYLRFINRSISLPLFYFLSHIPSFIYTAFIPLKDCPVELVQEIKNPLRGKWLDKIEKLKPNKIIIISHQEKTILETFIKNNPKLKKYNFEIISNLAFIKEGKFTGKSKIIITPHTKYGYINKEWLYFGDLRDYLLYGRKEDKFILI